jgi:vacuolar-type H+-ATPase subunit C/Vma6
VRSWLPGLLGRSGLEGLYSFPSSPAMREALRHTAYGADIEPPARVRARVASAGLAIRRFLGARERGLIEGYLRHHEVDNLKLLIRATSGHERWSDVAQRFVPLGDIASFDPQGLARCGDLPALVQALAATPYGPALKGALPRLADGGPFVLEVAAELDHYERLWEAAAALRARDAARAQALFGLLYDALNLSWIGRHRGEMGLSPEETLNYSLRQGRWVTVEVRRRLVEERPVNWGAALAGTPYGRFVPELQRDGFDAAAPGLWQLVARAARAELRGYPFHIGVPLGFLMLLDLEVRDLEVLMACKELGSPVAEALGQLVAA